MRKNVSTPRSGRGVLQHDSHADLLVDRSNLPISATGSRRDLPGAVIVPSVRHAAILDPIITMVADLGVPLVVLCSGPRTGVGQVVERMVRQLGARGIVARLDEVDDPSGLTFGTSDARFAEASGGRVSDLSAKRNAGLILARLRGWEKIVFLDDDVRLPADGLRRMARLLDESVVAGMLCRKFPDNSTLCHARRLAGQPQDVFVSGGVLGVRCSERELPFFPDVYCEDWFFIGEAAARRGLRKAGEAIQQEYDPYKPERARHEEFGDLLAEGLYSLIPSGGESFDQIVYDSSRGRYWDQFIEARRDVINRTRTILHRVQANRHCSPQVLSALSSLDEMDQQYDSGAITADVCIDFLEAWRKGTADWRNALPEPTPRASLSDAMDRLGVVEWQSVRMVDHGPTRSRSRLSDRPVSPLSGWTSPVGTNPSLV